MHCNEMPDTLGFMIVHTGKLLLKTINVTFAGISREITFEQISVEQFSHQKAPLPRIETLRIDNHQIKRRIGKRCMQARQGLKHRSRFGTRMKRHEAFGLRQQMLDIAAADLNDVESAVVALNFV